jgi:WD40 repeat protein
VAPDGSWLASIRWTDMIVRIWDVATGQQRAVLTGHTALVTAVAVAPDGSWLASGSDDGTVRIWDAATGQQRAVLTSQSRWVHAVAVAPDGSWLASGSRNDGAIEIWDAATGQQRARLTGHTAWVTAVAVAPDGNWLASGGDDGTVRIWDAATWHSQAMMRTDGVGIHCAWLGSDALVLNGSAGQYLFGFLKESTSSTARTSLRPPPHPGTRNDVMRAELLNWGEAAPTRQGTRCHAARSAQGNVSVPRKALYLSRPQRRLSGIKDLSMRTNPIKDDMCLAGGVSAETRAS